MANIEAYGTNIVGSGGSGGGLTQEEHAWLESLAAYEPNMYDINPNKSEDTYDAPRARTSDGIGFIPLCGYKKIALQARTSSTSSYLNFISSTGVVLGSIPASSISVNTWTSFIDIPDGSVMLKFDGTSYNTVYVYSLLANDN